MTVDYLSLLSKYTDGEHPQTVPALLIHSTLVTAKALRMAHTYLEKNPDAEIDLRLLEEIGMLHDVGIFKTNTPALFTTGETPYITHLQKGHEMLSAEGLLHHASAARNHSGIDKEAIKEQGLPLPHEDHVPQSTEEELLFLADAFYSKRFKELFHERSLEEVNSYLLQFPRKHALFSALWQKYCD